LYFIKNINPVMFIQNMKHGYYRFEKYTKIHAETNQSGPVCGGGAVVTKVLLRGQQQMSS